MTDNGGPFWSFTFEAFIATHPEIRHVGTQSRRPGRTGHANAGSTQWLYRHEIDDALQLAEQLAAYRHDCKAVRPNESITWNRPLDVHLGLADPTIHNLEIEEALATI